MTHQADSSRENIIPVPEGQIDQGLDKPRASQLLKLTSIDCFVRIYQVALKLMLQFNP